MEHENQSVTNKFNEHVSETQTRLASEALRRHQGDSPQVGSSATPQHEVIGETTQPTNDAQLSWADGDHRVSASGPHDTPFTQQTALNAGVGSNLERGGSPFPANFGRGLTSPPLCNESRSGRAQNMADILGGRE